MKRLTRIALWAAVASGALLTLSLVPTFLNLRYVSHSPVTILLPLFFASLFTLLVSGFFRSKGHLPRMIACGVAAMGLLIVGGFLMWLYSAFHFLTPSVRVETSPTGNHKLVIIESGFFDSAYSAYPMVNDFFYRDTDGGFISYHDFWADVECPEVEWISDAEARIWVPGGAHRESVGDAEEIIVRFD